MTDGRDSVDILLVTKSTIGTICTYNGNYERTDTTEVYNLEA